MVEEFNGLLNKSVASEETYTRWADYRKSITGFVTDSMWKNGSCIMLGSGNLMDIDLQIIYKNCSLLLLTDIDINAVNKGIELHGDLNNVLIEKHTLGGHDFDQLMQSVRDCMENNNLSGLKNLLDSYEFKSDFEIINYDNVIVSAVYTQLFIPQFLVLCEQFNLESEIKILMVEAALKFTARFISHVNGEIMLLAADDAAVCVWTDVLEYAQGSASLDDIKNHIDNLDWMEEFHQSYIRDFGHGLGSYGILNIADCLETIAQKWFIWPFNEYRTLVVKAISGRITSCKT